jgi:uncharacterized membrane protein (UPF0127 family)
MKRLAAVIILLAAVPVAFAQTDTSEPTAAQPPLPTQVVTIVSPTGARHRFRAEMATTPREQQVGEMFRTAIPADSGMFFDWGLPAHEQAMWMKNCPAPEDMVFIGPDGAIIHIAEDTVPYSEANIASGGPVRATLELQGGITAKLGISVGDHVYGPVFGPAPK